MGSLSRAITYDRDERGITVKGREPYGDTGLVIVAGVTPRQAGLRTKSYPLFRRHLGKADEIGAAGVPAPLAGAAEFAGPVSDYR